MNFSAFALLIITFIQIFKESKKMFIYLNITFILIIILGILSFYMNYGETWKSYIKPFLTTIVVLLIIPIVIINYLRHTPSKNEIEDIGQNED